jgi:hypothetical protein
MEVADCTLKPDNFDKIYARWRRGDFGKIRFPEVRVRAQGGAMLGVGRELMPMEYSSSFKGLVSAYLYDELGDKFFTDQAKLLFLNRHPLSQWHTLISKSESEIHNSPPEDRIAAELLWNYLGYHLYLLKENATLPADIINRLSHRDQFQGARYELFAAAVMVCAGYEIEWIHNSKDGKKVEFIATNSRTGTVFAVEAKSKHQEGILGFKEGENPKEIERLALRNLITKAIKKNPSQPLLVFVEANVPFTANEINDDLSNDISRAWDKINRNMVPEGFPCVGLIITNDTGIWQPGESIAKDKGYPNWVASFSGPNRFEIDVDEEVTRIKNSIILACRFPDLQWYNPLFTEDAINAHAKIVRQRYRD